MARQVNLKASVQAFLDNANATPEEAVALFKFSVKIKGWEMILGGTRASSKFIVAVMRRCSDDIGFFTKFLQSLKESKKDLSQMVGDELHHHAVLALLDRDREITVPMLKEYIECCVSFWSEMTWIWTTPTAVQKTGSALEELIRSRDMAEAKAALAFLSKLHDVNEDRSNWRLHFAKVLSKDDSFVNAMIDKLKALWAEDCDSEPARVFVGLWTGLYRLMSDDLDVKTTNRFFLMLEKCRASKLLNPAVACRLMRAYVKFTPSEKLNPPRRVRLLENFMKTLQKSLIPRNEKEQEERRLLSLEILAKVPCLPAVCQDVREKYLEDWVRVITHFPHEAAVRSWKIGFGLDGVQDVEGHYQMRSLQEVSPMDEMIPLLNSLTKCVRLERTEDRKAFTLVLFEALEMLLELKAKPELYVKCRNPLLVCAKFIFNAFSVDKDASQAPLVVKLAEYVMKLKSDSRKGDDVEFVTAASAAVEALQSVGEADGTVLKELAKIMQPDEHRKPAVASASRGMRTPASEGRKREPRTRGSGAPTSHAVVEEDTPKKLAFADVDSSKAIPPDIKDQDVEYMPPPGASRDRRGSDKRRIPPAPSLHDMDSQDFVVVNTPTKKPKLLTEHQTEVLTQRRPDIPALYSDLSQQSQNAYADSNSASSASGGPKEQKQHHGAISVRAPLPDFDEGARSSPPRAMSSTMAGFGRDAVTDPISDDEIQVIDGPVTRSSSKSISDASDGPGSDIEQIMPITSGDEGSGRRGRKQSEPKKKEDDRLRSKRRTRADTSSSSRPASTPRRSRKQPPTVPVQTENVWLSSGMLARKDDTTSRQRGGTASPASKTQPPNPAPTAVEDDDVIFDSQEKGRKSHRVLGRSLTRRISDPNFDSTKSENKLEKDNKDRSVGEPTEKQDGEVADPLLGETADASPVALLTPDPAMTNKSVHGATTSVTPNSILKRIEKAQSETKLKVRFNPDVEEIRIQQETQDSLGASLPDPEATPSEERTSGPPPLSNTSGFCGIGETPDEEITPFGGVPKRLDTTIYEDTPLEDRRSKDEEIVFPAHVGRHEPVSELACLLTTATWVETFVEKLENMNVTTVGGFCALKGFQLKTLPITGRSENFVDTAREKIKAWLKEQEGKEEELEETLVAPIRGTPDSDRMDTEEIAAVVKDVSQVGVKTPGVPQQYGPLTIDLPAIKKHGAQLEHIHSFVDSVGTAGDAFAAIRYMSQLQEHLAAKFSEN